MLSVVLKGAAPIEVLKGNKIIMGLSCRGSIMFDLVRKDLQVIVLNV